MSQDSLRLGEILIEQGLLTRAQVDLALEDQKLSKDFFGNILVKRKFVSETQLATALSRQFNLPFVSLSFNEIDWDLRRHYEALFLEQNCFPCSQDSSSITVAIYNPLDAWTISQIEFQAKGRSVNFVIATKTKISEAINEFRKRSLNQKRRECA